MATFLIYIPCLKGEFVVDDVPQIKDNLYIRSYNHVPGYFTKGVWANSSLEVDTVPIYRPIHLIAEWLNYAIWGNNPTGYHIFLLLLHLVNTFLVYILIRSLVASSVMGATLSAALFALHPAKMESVAWISGMTDPLVTLFLLLALLAHRATVNSQKGWRYIILSLLCFQLALWSKEVAIFFPLLVIAHDLIYMRKICWPVTWAHAAIVVGYMLMRNATLGETGGQGAFDLTHISRAFDLALGYSELLVFPAQIPFYIRPPEHSVSSFLGWLGAAVVIALAVYSLRAFDPERRKTLLFSIAWFTGFSWQAILLMFYLDGYISPRFLYLPSAGMAIFAAALYGYLSNNHERLRNLFALSSLLLITGYAFVTWQEIPAWNSNESIYRKVTKSAPENAEGFIGLGRFYLEQENYAMAEENFLVALQKARVPQTRLDSLVPLGTIYGMANKLVQSEQYFREAVQIEPGNPIALAGLGNLAWMRGQVYEAIGWYEKALAARPGNYEVAMNLAMAYEQTGQVGRAASIRDGMTKPQQH